MLKPAWLRVQQTLVETLDVPSMPPMPATHPAAGNRFIEVLIEATEATATQKG
ncbi:hypothetical protein X747_31925 [Mesorhizobium sp. LNJC384A00]|nr:hypothetical protein X747_31925 [Mesorhizobium sp. LNJC384A00]